MSDEVLQRTAPTRIRTGSASPSGVATDPRAHGHILPPKQCGWARQRRSMREPPAPPWLSSWREDFRNGTMLDMMEKIRDYQEWSSPSDERGHRELALVGL